MSLIQWCAKQTDFLLPRPIPALACLKCLASHPDIPCSSTDACSRFAVVEICSTECRRAIDVVGDTNQRSSTLDDGDLLFVERLGKWNLRSSACCAGRPPAQQRRCRIRHPRRCRRVLELTGVRRFVRGFRDQPECRAGKLLGFLDRCSQPPKVQREKVFRPWRVASGGNSSAGRSSTKVSPASAIDPCRQSPRITGPRSVDSSTRSRRGLCSMEANPCSPAWARDRSEDRGSRPARAPRASRG